MTDLSTNNQIPPVEFSTGDASDFRIQIPSLAETISFGSTFPKDVRDNAPDFPTDFGYTLPDVVWNIPAKARAKAARFTTDVCDYDGRFFIRGVLHIPFQDAEKLFSWGVWAEVDFSVFERYVALYEVDGSNEPPHPGTLAHELPAYPASLSLPLQIQFQRRIDRPTFTLAQEAPGRLPLDQRNGIEQARYRQILAAIDAKGRRPLNWRSSQ
jgi:hypothetical protein